MKKILALCILLSSIHWDVDAVTIRQLKETIKRGDDVTLSLQLQQFGMHRLTPTLIDILCAHAQTHNNSIAGVLLQRYLPQTSTSTEPKLTPHHHDLTRYLFGLLVVLLWHPSTSSDQTPFGQIADRLSTLRQQHRYAQLLWYCCLGRLLRITSETLAQQQRDIQALEDFALKQRHKQAHTISKRILHLAAAAA